MGDFDRNPVLTLLTVLSEFDVTASTDCSSDYVTVTTGDPAQVLEAFMDPILGLKNPERLLKILRDFDSYLVLDLDLEETRNFHFFSFFVATGRHFYQILWQVAPCLH